MLVVLVAPSVAGQAPPTIAPRMVTEAPRLDGRLDDAAWRSAPALGAFRQVEPAQGASAQLPTTVRVVQHARGLWFGIVAHDTAGRAGLRVADLRREFDPDANDVVGIILGPLGDRRNATAFEVTPAGTQRDLQVLDGSIRNVEWDGVWAVQTTVHDSGWTAEIFIPWATLRYDASERPWDFNVYRLARRTNELSAWNPWPRNFNAYRLDFAGQVIGLTPPPPSQQLAARPYVLSRTRAGAAGAGSDVALGGEVTWSPTSNTALDLTVNTDFAQTDVDRPVINLTRFSVFLPERRQFFLEGASLFSVGRTTGQFAITPFFSRRIGLDADGQPIPITAGARILRRGTRTNLGALWVRQEGLGATPPAHFAVGRATRNVGERGRLGALATARIREDGGGASTTLSGDWFTRFGEEVTFNGFVSASHDEGTTGVGGAFFLGRQTNRLYTGMLATLATRDYAPATGFVSRSNTLELSPAIICDWRPAWRPGAIRQFQPALLSYTYHDPATLALQEGFLQGYVDVVWQNGAVLYPYVERHLQRPRAAFALLPGVMIAPGEHDYWRTGVSATSNPGARTGGAADLSVGSFFDGNLTSASLTGRLSPSPRAALTATWEINRFTGIGVGDSSLVTHLVTPELRLALSPRVSATTFYQYNSTTGVRAINARLTWEYLPLSYLFVVYNGSTTAGAPRSLTIKMNMLLQR